MWATTGNHGHQWTYANVILSNPAPFRVTFEGEVGGDKWTNIALDDISFTPECVAAGTVKIFFFPGFFNCNLFSVVCLLKLRLALFPYEFLQTLMGECSELTEQFAQFIHTNELQRLHRLHIVCVCMCVCIYLCVY